MAIMYKIIGGDQKEYGMVSAEDMRKWIAEGRLSAQTLAKAEGDEEFRPLGGFPEFVAALAAAAAEPLQTPTAIQPARDDGRDAALQQVKGPAIALIITAGLGVAYYGFSGLFTLFTGGAMFHQEMPPNIPPQMQAFIEGMQGPLAGMLNLVIAALNGFVLFGALKLLRLQNRSIATVASVAAMLPCQCCCVFGLPFGIWALVVLNKPEVKSQFT
jgi:hypothetical protein